MAFGQQAGPPATGKQVQTLLALVQAAGHTDFRDARGALGLTQRQAGGKFTRDEADALIEQLEGEGHEAAQRLSPDEQALRGISSETLAGELQRRGWVVLAP